MAPTISPVTPSVASLRREQWSQFWRSDSWDINRMALREWGNSVFGIGLLLMCELATAGPFGDPVTDHASRLWDVLTRLIPTYVEGLGSLAGIVTIPVTFFVAVCLTDESVAGTRWSQETRLHAAKLLRWSSRVASVVSWCFIPPLIELSTPLLGVSFPLAAQVLCAYTAAMAVTGRASAISYDKVTRHLSEAEAGLLSLQEDMPAQPGEWPWWHRLAQSPQRFGIFQVMVVSVFCVPALVTEGVSGALLVCLAACALLMARQWRGIHNPPVKRRSGGRGGARRVVSAVMGIASGIVAANIVIHFFARVDGDGHIGENHALWALLPLAPVLGCTWVVSKMEAFHLFIPTRVAASVREIEHFRRAQYLATQLMESTSGAAEPLTGETRTASKG